MIGKKIKASTKGFTLVELIVVITILAILGTIAFISFGSQSSAARDSKRKTDLSSLASKMNVALANGTTYLGLVGTQSNLVTSISIAGTGVITTGTTQNYTAGLINFNVLGVNSGDFKDADNTSDYKIGATSNAGGAFQLAAKLENDNNGNQGANALLVGNFNQRFNTTTGAIESASSATFTLPNSMVGFIKKGDYVLVGTATGSVTSVSSDLAKVTTSVASPTTGQEIKLLASESEGLVGDSNGDPIKNGDTTDFPY